ncbi:Hypothetical predicted protein, partial [Pelobates cultripes]
EGTNKRQMEENQDLCQREGRSEYDYLLSHLDTQFGKLRVEIQANTIDIKKELLTRNQRFLGIEEKLNGLEHDENAHKEEQLALEKKMADIENKLVDLEDPSRPNNLRIRGVSEQINLKNLEPYIEEFLKHLKVE